MAVTPGTWTVIDGHNFVIRTSALEGEAAYVAQAYTRPDADAIAAIPSMLEALKYIVAHEKDEILERTARAALLKAEGAA